LLNVFLFMQIHLKSVSLYRPNINTIMYEQKKRHIHNCFVSEGRHSFSKRNCGNTNEIQKEKEKREKERNRFGFLTREKIWKIYNEKL